MEHRAKRNKLSIGVALGVLLFALCVPVHAQQSAKIFRIGFLDPSTASGMAVLIDAFRQELNKLGWMERKNISIDYRFAEQKLDRLPELAAELVRMKVDLIAVSGTPPAVAARKRPRPSLLSWRTLRIQWVPVW